MTILSSIKMTVSARNFTIPYQRYMIQTNEGFGSTAHDVSGHNLNGTIYSPLNTPWSDGWIPGYPLVLP
jgi:hypothetical protein